MTTKEKLDYINNHQLEKLNRRLTNRGFIAEFENRGANYYCLKLDDRYYKFNTYDDLISCLDFIDDMFEKAKKEMKGGNV